MKKPMARKVSAKPNKGAMAEPMKITGEAAPRRNDRAGFKRGGAVKRGATVNIVIGGPAGAPGGAAPMPPAGLAGLAGPPPKMMAPPMPPPGAMPPPGPAMPPPGAPPMKRGGKVAFAKGGRVMAGSGTGLGRLEKAEDAKKGCK